MFFKRKSKLPIVVDATPVERENFYSEYGQLMRHVRQALKLTLADLSKQLQIPEQDLEKYECGHPVPIIEGIAIYQFLGMQQKMNK